MTPAERWTEKVVTTIDDIKSLLVDQTVWLNEGQQEELIIAWGRMREEPRLRYAYLAKARRGSTLPRSLVELDWIHPPVLSSRPLVGRLGWTGAP